METRPTESHTALTAGGMLRTSTPPRSGPMTATAWPLSAAHGRPRVPGSTRFDGDP
jgi:hypothetical protein